MTLTARWRTLSRENRLLAGAFAFSGAVHLCIWLAGTGYFHWNSTMRPPAGTMVSLVTSVPGTKGHHTSAKKQGKKSPPAVSKKLKKPTNRNKEKTVAPKQQRKDLTQKKDTVSLKPIVRKKKLDQAKPSQAQPPKTSTKKVSTPKLSTSDRLSDFLKGARNNGAKSGGVPGVAKGDSHANSLMLGFYLSNLQQRIHQLWQIPPGYDEPDLQVKFRISIAADGTLLKKALIQSSGSDLFDHSASVALEDAAPFATLPAGIDAPLQIVIRLLPGE